MSVHVPDAGLGEGSRYTVVMAFMGVKVKVRGDPEWEPPSHAMDPAPRAAGRHDQHHRVEAPSRPQRAPARGDLPLAAPRRAGLTAVGGAQLGIKHGTLAQKRRIEEG